MAEHSLTIDSFRTQLGLIGRRDDGLSLGREASRAVRDLLPGAIAAALAPLLGSRDGVLRINWIALTLQLERRDISALRLADLLARDIARAIAEHAEGAGAAPRVGAGFAYWPDRMSFAASYLAHRLRLVPAPDWAFAEFRPLAHLAPHEAAYELIVARSAILAALARLVGAAAAPALARSLTEESAAVLIEQLASDDPAELPAEVTGELAAMIAALPAKIDSSPAQAMIATAATALVAGTTSDAATVRRTVMLARIAVALAALRAAIRTTTGRAPLARDLVPDTFVHLPEPARRLAEAALAPLTRVELIRATLIRVLDRVTLPQGAAQVTAPAAAAPPALRVITSRIAGIGLLMPAALAFSLPDLLSPAAFNLTLAAAAGADGEAEARLDPLLGALAPFDPRAADDAFPPLPEALRDTVPQARREGVARQEGAAGWAACLTHAFAASLTGFEQSSLPYLRAQFLARPGTLHIAADRLTLVLDPLPLGILLRLCGLHGWSGRLPQARDAMLRIVVRDS